MLQATAATSVVITAVSEAPYVNGWTSSVLTATTADMTFRDRFYNRVILPIKTMSAMRPSLVKLQQIKDDLGVMVAGGPGPQRFSKTLKIINTFVGFEVSSGVVCRSRRAHRLHR